MSYTELIFTLSSPEDYHQDLLINQLSEIGFDTFEETDTGFKAYIPSSGFDQQELTKNLKNFEGDFKFTYEINFIPHKNWNEVWESNFEPLRINNLCYVRATFHEPHPEYLYEIVIDPKMAFGTGHHQTTAMMMNLMTKDNFKGKSVLDMGCGTGILAILASKLGSTEILAIDNDPVCYESTIENSKLNTIKNITVLCGSKEIIPDQKFDIILANINRNILLDQLERYSQVLNPKGTVYLSGFYAETNLNIIISKAQTYGLTYNCHKKLKGWAAVKFYHNY
ncbi:MAG: 50S ribosomal protein L11 methyltransferase [Daejeonella sp.]